MPNPQNRQSVTLKIIRRGLFRRALSSLLIVAVLIPVLFFGKIKSASASPSQPVINVPASAPPEVFLTPATFTSLSGIGSTFVGLRHDLLSLVSSTNPFTGAIVSNGLLADITASLGRLLGVAAPSLNANPALLPTAVGPVKFDFNNDGKADIGRFHGSNYEMKVAYSGSTSTATYTIGSSSSAKSAPGDFNGDGSTDAAVFDAGTWTYKVSPTATPQTISLGASGDTPMPGDYDGDGTTDAAVFTPSTNVWSIKNSSDGTTATYNFGSSGDIPINGDFDGDGKADIAVYRPTQSPSYWYVRQSSNGSTLSIQWGLPNDVPVQGDFDGDGKSDPTVYRPSTGTWYAGKSSTSYTKTIQVGWGSYGDQPTPADYDGDGITDFSVWRPTTGVWFTIKSSDSTYLYQTLGVAGDTAVPSSFTKQIAGTVSGYDMANARLSPRNATGGTNLYSQNFSWSTSLVELPGRSGMDAALGISYNSLVWIKNSNVMYFDPDTSSVAPGFRMGLPTIEPAYYDSVKSKWEYMLVTPDGTRTEFRQLGASSTYETADLTYTQLVTTGASSPNSPVEGITIKVITTDGTQSFYAWVAGAFRCNKVMDRNGNFITVTHDTQGLLTKITDTLGREVNVAYDAALNPTSVTQTWKDSNGSGSNTTHTYATFSYTTLTTSIDFGTLPVVGPTTGTVLKVLDKITYADGSYTKFLYNGYAQVKQVERYAPDNHKLNHTRTNLDSVSGTQSDCPRFTETSNYAENFNSGNVVTTTNSAPTGATYSLPGSISGSASKITVATTNHPNNLSTNIYVGSSGWNEGLPIATEDCVTTTCSGTDRVRWTWTNWEQDSYENVTPSYTLNPRVIETRVGDGTNTKRATMTYLQDPSAQCEGCSNNVAYYGLVGEQDVYGTDLNTIKKKTTLQYNFGLTYKSRRVLGLPTQVDSWGWNDLTNSLEYVSKVTYAYDEGNFGDSSLAQNINPVQRDSAYSALFIVGRGNVTSVKRWDVRSGYENNSAYAVTRSAKYNNAGSVVSQTDPLGRVSKVFYTDSFNSSVGVSTYAYPTTITDAGGNSSTLKYRYDIGANVEATTPVPYGATYGKTTKRVFDFVGRLERDSVYISNSEYSYTRYARPNPDNGLQLFAYSTLVDTGTAGAGPEDEAYFETVFDGAGNVRAKRMENPGSTGGYSGTLTEYDIVGRVKRTTVPTEIDSGWHPTGDDYRGTADLWLWNTTEYDWKGRATRTIPSDSTGSDGKDTLVSYGGCGCAGGQTTTVKGPVSDVIDADGNMQTTKRRMQKIYEDFLGRPFSTELYNLEDGAVYRTTLTKYNGRDQVVNFAEYAGTTSGTHQDTETTYDGHGRVSTLHKPEWYGTSATTDKRYTTTTYNGDDTVATVTDPRGAVATYTYENVAGTPKRPLVTKVEYAPPSPNATPPQYIPDVPDVTFAYDAAGNRQTMSDGSGTLDYSYDSLSRLLTETKTFSDDLTHPYTLTYEYFLGAGLKSIDDPFGHKTTYAADKLGRLTSVGAAGSSNLSGTTAYASDIKYRAFGGVKEMKYSTTAQTTVSLTYDNALRPAAYVANNSVANDIQSASYTYGGDGASKAVANSVHTNFNQINEYDFAGRLKKNDVGHTGATYPLKQTMSYDAFDNLTGRTTYTWQDYYDDFTATYANNRKTYGPHTFEYFNTAGDVVESHFTTYDSPGGGRSYDDVKKWTFDAAGRMARWEETGPWTSYPTTHSADNTFDGDGRLVISTAIDEDGNVPWHYIYSSVTGQKITDLVPDVNGPIPIAMNVYLGSTRIAQELSTDTSFDLHDPVTGSLQQIVPSGAVPSDANQAERYPSHTEMAGLGTAAPVTQPTAYPQPHYNHGGFSGDAEFGCKVMIDGWFEVGSFSCSPSQTAGSDTDYFDIYKSGHVDNTHPDTPPGEVSDDDVIRVHADTTITRSWIGAIMLLHGFYGQPSQSVCSLSGLNIPEVANIRNNIKAAEAHKLTGLTITGALFGVVAAANAAGDYNKAKWFENQVKDARGRVDDVRSGQSWDYKQLDPAKYENFGNWNYGLTGAAMGFSERLLLRKAGEANLNDMNPNDRAEAERKWGTPGNILTDPNGGTGSFGDEPKDQYWIHLGYQYYTHNCGNR